MDRKKSPHWLLPLCLALASGCETRSTPARPDSVWGPVRPTEWQITGAAPRRFVAPVASSEVGTSYPADGEELPDSFDAGLPPTTGRDPSSAWGGETFPPPVNVAADRSGGPALPDANPYSQREAPGEMTPLPTSEPIGDDALSTTRLPAAALSVPSSPLATPTEAVAIQQRLPWAAERPRTAEMDAVAKSADVLIRQGFRLAERGAVYSARLKFFEALSLIAQSLDVTQQTQAYSRALVAGRTALDEAWDFRIGGLPIGTDLGRIIAAHRTQLLVGAPLDTLSPVLAQQRYFSYAQEQMALAAGREPVGSLALYGLGKSAPQVHHSTDAPNLTIAGEQMACYQAALMVDSRNFRAAHELGVLLAAHGRLEAARDLFLQSLAISENAATWRNLSVVWRQLGDPQQAAEASRRADHLMNTRFGAITGNNLRWVDPETFARALPPGEAPVTPPPAAAAPATAAPPAKKRVAQWPWSSQSKQ
ncbi:MAG TPA: hypothetical protein VMF30_03355 [Pirellulales bacterium]|nr:hypothetical protein [Pirellulales bacterium]